MLCGKQPQIPVKNQILMTMMSYREEKNPIPIIIKQTEYQPNLINTKYKEKETRKKPINLFRIGKFSFLSICSFA